MNTIVSEPIQIGRIRVEGFTAAPAPDLSNRDVVARILADAREVARRESALRRGQRKSRAA